MQSKKPIYDLYPQLNQKLCSVFRREMLGGKERKSATDVNVMRKILSFQPDLVQTLDFLILSEEYFWDRQGSHVLFPQSDAVLTNLLKANYVMTEQGFSLPFDSFVLAMPHGYQFEGVALPSFMVSMLPYQTAQEYSIFPYCDHLKIPRPGTVAHGDSPDNARCITLSYRDANNSMMYSRVLQTEDKLPSILAAKNTQEFRAAVGEYSHTKGIIASDEMDLKIQFICVKLVAAIGVYNLATEGQRLVDGFPGNIAPKMMGSRNERPLKPFTIKNASEVTRERELIDPHYRTWHFRQLRDERYYRGQYAEQPVGSRYSFVTDTLVGQKVSPHTQR